MRFRREQWLSLLTGSGLVVEGDVIKENPHTRRLISFRWCQCPHASWKVAVDPRGTCIPFQHTSWSAVRSFSPQVFTEHLQHVSSAGTAVSKRRNPCLHGPRLYRPSGRALQCDREGRQSQKCPSLLGSEQGTALAPQKAVCPVSPRTVTEQLLRAGDLGKPSGMQRPQTRPTLQCVISLRPTRSLLQICFV